jgi:transcriptional regulator with XRE-family HTH domain
VESELTKWVKEQLQIRGWSVRELGRRGNLSHSLISQVLTGKVPPSNNFCYSIAQVFDTPPERIFRLAGILPFSASEDEGTIQESLELLRGMPPDKRKLALRLLRSLYRDED